MEVKQSEEEGFISIVGAVRASDVFTTKKSRISLNELLKAAGGFAEGASTTFRVFRNGNIRYQAQYDEQQPVMLERGDVVVVVPMPTHTLKQEDLVPVVCLGLAPRPVCLLLEQNITTVSILAQRLLQKDQVAQAAQVFDPFGRSRQQFLVPGAVVVFDPASIDQQQLRATQQFPPPRPLEPNEPQKSTNHQAPEITENGLRSWPVRVQPSAVNQSNPLTARPHRNQASTSSPVGTAVPSTSIDIPSPLFSSENTVTVEPSPAFQSHVQEVAAPQLPPPKVHRAEPASWETDGKLAANPSTELIPEPEPTLAQPIATAKVEPAVSSESAPAPPVSKPATKPAKTTSRSWGYVALTLGGLAVLCLVGSVLLSQLDRESVADFRVPRTEAADAQESKESNELDPSAAIIEEQILIPHQTALHGIAIGHRRIMVHERHTELAGPHFGERAKRKRQREVVHAVERQIESESPAETELPDRAEVAPQVTINPSPNEFDVVQPETEKSSPAINTLGPLDRALRAINKEIRG